MTRVDGNRRLLLAVVVAATFMYAFDTNVVNVALPSLQRRLHPASGTLNTIQQFAGATGLAVIGAVFYAVLGAHPTPGRYAMGAETVAWIGLGLIGVIAALTTLLPTPSGPTPAIRPLPAGAAADEPVAAPASS